MTTYYGRMLEMLDDHVGDVLTTSHFVGEIVEPPEQINKMLCRLEMLGFVKGAEKDDKKPLSGNLEWTVLRELQRSDDLLLRTIDGRRKS